jgi:MutL protein
MPTASQPVKCLLSININPVIIQVCLIDQQESIYRIAGVGRGPISYGLNGSIDRRCLVKVLHELAVSTGHELLGENNDVLTPSENPRRGVDRISLTWSLPAPIKVILIGLMPALSMKAGIRLIEELPLEIVDQIYTTDGRTEEEKMDSILSLRPDLIVLTGGVEDGAVDVVKSSADLLARSFSALPPELRPEVVYAGNSRAAEYVKNKIEPVTLIFTAANIQPTLSELDIQPAREVLSSVCNRMWVKRFGLQPGIRPLTFDLTRLSIRAIEDFISILGISEKKRHGALAIQLNGLGTGVSVSLDGRSTSYQQLKGCRAADPGRMIKEYKPEDVSAWSQEPVEPAGLADYLAAELLYPGRLPVTAVDAALGGSITRLAGMRAWQALSEKQDFPRQLKYKKIGAEVDLILITGNRLQNQQNQGPALLEMLDIIQPIGISEVFIDLDGVAAALGAAAQLNPRIPLHCILGEAVPRLATVIAPMFQGRDGVKLLTVSLTFDDGREFSQEIRSGSLTFLRLEPQEKARLKIIPRSGLKMGARFGQKNNIPVKGSLLGIVVDARGRPLTPRKNPREQQDWMKRTIDQMMDLER